MLNISPVSIIGKVDRGQFQTFKDLKVLRTYSTVKRVLVIFLILFLLFMMLPWTQNVQGDGLVTTVRPEQRPQTIQSVITGRVNKWYVGEGDFVAKGDTILEIVEILDAFFDPDLIARTDRQIAARVEGYKANQQRVKALEEQIVAMKATRDIRLEQIQNTIRQAELKVNSDSIRFKAAQTEVEVAELQLERSNRLIEEGLVSLTDLETRKIRVQEAEARIIGAENQLLISQNDLLNAQAERLSIINEFSDRIAKANADLKSAIISLYDIDVDIEQRKNMLVNLEVRSGYRYVVAPQDGYIAQAIVEGVGENISEGEPLVSIMPSNYDLAVAFWIRPIDLPLIKIGYKVRFIFDGWPAFFFSGWPQTSFGTFGGQVIAIDKFTDENNLYRILVQADPGDKPWPQELRVGSGAKGFALLGDVPLWYEIWRVLNGFPPEYYTKNPNKKKALEKRKKPIKSFK